MGPVSAAQLALTAVAVAATIYAAHHARAAHHAAHHARPRKPARRKVGPVLAFASIANDQEPALADLEVPAWGKVEGKPLANLLLYGPRRSARRR